MRIIIKTKGFDQEDVGIIMKIEKVHHEALKVDHEDHHEDLKEVLWIPRIPWNHLECLEIIMKI